MLLGDMLLTWCDEMFGRLRSATGRRCAAARPLFDLMRSEVMAGQYLDVLAQAAAATTHPDGDPSSGPRR